MFMTCPLYRAVVHHSVWIRHWVASSTVAYLVLGFHLENKWKSMFWRVIYEKFKRRNISCLMGNVFVLNRKEANENMTAGTFLLGLRNYCKDIDVDPSNNRFNFTGLSGFGSNNFALESTVSGRLVVSRLWLYFRLSHFIRQLIKYYKFFEFIVCTRKKEIL